MRTLTALLLLAACRDKANVGDDSDSAAPSPEAPLVTGVEAYCYLHDVGDQFYQWIFGGVVDDPQGVETLESFADLHIYRGGGVIEELEGLLVVSDDGQLVGSFKEETYGISCGSASEYTFRFIAYDVDGHSGYAEIAGSQQ